MSQFVGLVREFAGGVTVPGPIDAAFELFSPEGERRWVPGWNPTFIAPAAPGSWAEGQVFLTDEEGDEATWVVTALDRGARFVEYHRVVPRRYVARIRVRCAAASDGVAVSVVYTFIGLSPKGNAEIAAMTDQAYAEKMQRWEQWIRES